MKHSLAHQLLVAVCLLSIALAVPSDVRAQAPTQTVTGHVVDPQGAAIAGAIASLEASGRVVRTTRTLSDGSFSLAAPAGAYALLVNAPGFAASTRAVTLGAPPTSVSVTLQVATVVEGVTVRDAYPGIAATGKTSLPFSEMPMTVQAVSRETIDAQGANDLVTALKNVPGANAFTTYGVYEYYSFRGFLDSVQLLDGVRNEGNRTNTQLTDIERVEVLKGPASALYGGGALGATVNLIRKKPTVAPSYEVMGAFGSWGLGRGAFGAGGRIGSDRFMYRLDVGGEGREGYRHDNAKRLSVAPSVAWQRDSRNRFTLSYTFNRDAFGGDAGLPLVDTGLGVPVAVNVPDVPRDRNYRTPFDSARSHDQNLQAGYVRQISDAVTFRDTFSYRRFDDEYFLAEEVDFNAPRTIDRFYLYFKHHRRPLMNIAELSVHKHGRVAQDVLVGLESQRYHNFTTLPEEDFFDAASIDAFAPVETQQPSDLTIASQNVFTNTTNALYAQDHISLGPRVKVLLGGRYDVYRRTSHSDAIDDGIVTPGAPVRTRANAFSGRAGLVYQPVQHVDIYGSIANSFKPLTQVQPDGTSLDPETGSQFEVGQRWRALRDRVELSSSLYRIRRQHVAFRRSGNVFVQAGEMESRGFEVEVTTSPGPRWHVNASYALTDAQFLDYEERVGTNLRGNTPVFAPRHTLNVWTGYTLSGGWAVNVGARYVGKVFADNDNLFQVDGYGVINVGLSYRRGPLEYAVNVNNLGNTKYFIPHQDYLQVYPGEPTNVLATVRLRLR